VIDLRDHDEIKRALARAERLSRARLKAVRDLSRKLRESRKQHDKTKKILQSAIKAGRDLQDVIAGLRVVISKEQRARQRIEGFLHVLLERLQAEDFDRESAAKTIGDFLGLEAGEQSDPDGPVGGILSKLG
jgi:hypothetical protein